MVKRISLLIVFLISYATVITPFSHYMTNKPFAEKLGYVPESGILKLLSADQYRLVAAALILKTTAYFGGIVEHAQNKIYIPPEYAEMQKMLETAVKLDPYNMDAYYFAQAIMSWDARHFAATNALLEYGMQYRTWDYYLPYFAGFNYAYFLKDYANAARYYGRVAELTGDELITKLTGRYLYESGRTDLAISYLEMMKKNATNDAVRKTLEVRLTAFLRVKEIERAMDSYLQAFHKPPKTIDVLVSHGFLTQKPLDPYGGRFYIDRKGMVRTTSKFVFSVAGHQ